MNKSTTGSLRDNVGKAPVHKVPLIVDEAIATVLFKSSIEGGGKYPDGNWKLGNAHSVPISSAIRHLKKLAEGEANDAESGLPHSYHAACNIMFLLYYQVHFPELNDLLPPSKPVVAEQVEAIASPVSTAGQHTLENQRINQQQSNQATSGLVNILGPLLATLATQVSAKESIHEQGNLQYVPESHRNKQ